MPIESVTHIADLVATNPVGSTDKVQTLDDHIRNIKTALLNDFANITGAITASTAEINVLDGMTASTAELNLLDGVTSSTAELNILDGVTLTAAQINDAARLSVANTFTAATQTINANAPSLDLRNTAAASGLKHWVMQAETDGDLAFYTRTDAGGAVENAMKFTRNSASEVTGVVFTADAITFNGVSLADIARLSIANTFTQNQTIGIGGGSPLFVTTDGTTSTQYGVSNALALGYVGTSTAHPFALLTNSGIRLQISSGGNFDFKSGTVTTTAADASEVGFRGVPIVTKTADYTVITTDAGYNVTATSACDEVTFTSASLAAGMAVMVTNGLAGNLTLVQGSGASLYLTGTGTAANRTIAPNGFATVYHYSGGTFLVQGPGVS